MNSKFTEFIFGFVVGAAVAMLSAPLRDKPPAKANEFALRVSCQIYPGGPFIQVLPNLQPDVFAPTYYVLTEKGREFLGLFDTSLYPGCRLSARVQ